MKIRTNITISPGPTEYTDGRNVRSVRPEFASTSLLKMVEAEEREPESFGPSAFFGALGLATACFIMAAIAAGMVRL